MSASILSQDILAICLLFADGEVDLSLEEVIKRLEKFQKQENRHFGIGQEDFRALIRNLIFFELGFKKQKYEFDCENDYGIDTIKLSDIVMDILSYDFVWFNDEGEYWRTWERSRDSDNYDFWIKRWYDYTKQQYQDKQKAKKEMKKFFEKHPINTLYAEAVKDLLERCSITKSVLYHCSRVGTDS